MAGRRTTVSLEDVAEAAGVSVATASRVLSGAEYPVAEATRDRVEQAAAELGYERNRFAGALVKRERSGLVGVIVGAVTDPYFAEVARGAEEYARRSRLLTIVCNTGRDAASELEYLRFLSEYRATGVILATGSFDEAHDVLAPEVPPMLERLTEGGLQVVSTVDRGLDAVPTVCVDNARMVEDLVAHLVTTGHRRIGFVAGPDGFSTSEQRERGFRAAAQRLGLEQAPVFPGGFSFEHGRQSAMRILRQKQLPDAVIGYSDESAIGILFGLREAGVDVPGEVSVAGIDDTRDAKLMDLTTVSVPAYELGASAASVIVNGTRDGASQVYPHRIVTRGTTASRAPAR